MRSFLFTTLAISLILVALTALVIRYEMISPGASSLFITQNGDPRGFTFPHFLRLHSLLASLAVLLIGTSFCAAARESNVQGAAVMMWLGTLSAVLLIAGIILWAPLSPSPASDESFLPKPADERAEWLLSLIGLNLFTLESILIETLRMAIFLPLSGLFMQAATTPGMRWVGITGTVIAALWVWFQGLTSLFPQLLENTRYMSPIVYFLMYSFLAFICWLSTRKSNSPAGIMIMIGLIMPFLAWHALPALIIATASRPPPVSIVWRPAIGITLALTPWISGMIWTGSIMSQDYASMDYDPALTTANRIVSAGVLTFILIYATILWKLFRTTRQPYPINRA